MLVVQTSIPPEPAVNSTVSFWRAWSSGNSANSTLMPVCFSKSGSIFCIVVGPGVLGDLDEDLAPLESLPGEAVRGPGDPHDERAHGYPDRRGGPDAQDIPTASSSSMAYQPASAAS